MKMKLFARPSTISDPKNESRRLVIFAFVLIANLLIIGCLLVFWNANAIISDDSSTYAILIVGAVSGLFFLFCMVFLLICFATTSDPTRNAIQSVYPTPEFQYFTSTMLTRVKQKNENTMLKPHQNDNFSILTTQPASSVSTITVSPVYNGDFSRESLGILPYEYRTNGGDYMRVY